MRKWNSESGMSLVEATIILMTLAILTAVIAPSAGDYINEARNVKAKEDVEAIGTGVLRLLRDTGNKCLKAASATGCTTANRIDLLVSGSSAASVADAAKAVSAADSAALTGTANTPYNWAPDAQAPAAGNRATIDDQLVTNTTVAYTAVSFTGGGGPNKAVGWRGAYLTGPIDKDPWGYRYEANTAFLGVATNAATGGGEGNSDGGWTYDAVVLSPGSDGVIETPFASSGNSATGDDVIFVIKGSTR